MRRFSTLHTGWCLGCILLVFISLSFAGTSVVIDRSGRRILLDAFLMDWSEKNKRPWSGSTVWNWDAVNTSEGVAGYFHASSAACSLWTFFVDSRHFTSPPYKMRSDASRGNSLYRTACSSQEQSFAITFEWLIPWDSLDLDSAGIFTVNCAGISACGDTLDPLLITGSSPRRPNRLPSRFTERIIIMGLLLATFIFLQRRIRKKSRRKVSLHRSA